jgi:hypothetical protein
MSKIPMTFRIRSDLAEKLKQENNATELIEYYLDRHYNKQNLKNIQVEKLNNYLKVIINEEIEEYKAE